MSKLWGRRIVARVAIGIGILVAPHVVLAGSPGPDGGPAGAVLFEHHCAGCHAPGPGHPATMLLGELGRDHPALVENPDLDADYIRSIVRGGLIEMPPFRPTELSDAEVDAIIAHITAAHPK